MARAPVTLDVARALAAEGCEVHVADCVEYNLCRHARAVAGYHRTPAPAADPKGYLEAIAAVVESFAIDLVVPVGEEIFFLAAGRHLLPRRCTLVADSFEKLAQLHDKGRLIELCASLGLAVPKTERLDSTRALAAAIRTAQRPLAIKPAFTRFAAQTRIVQPGQELPRDIDNALGPWLAQEYVSGTQICTYSICRDGCVLLHVTYETPYTSASPGQRRRGLRGPGIHFQETRLPLVEAWVERFVRATGFTGQIGFDLILDGDGTLYPIDCNPRMTSGVHLIANAAALHRSLCHGLPAGKRHPAAPAMIGHLMFREAIGQLLLAPRYAKRAFRHLRAARDVTDPAGELRVKLDRMLLVSAFTVLRLLRGRKVYELWTRDIFWDGDRREMNALLVQTTSSSVKDSAQNPHTVSGRSGSRTTQERAIRAAKASADAR